jgi:hypothetical protein
MLHLEELNNIFHNYEDFSSQRQSGEERRRTEELREDGRESYQQMICAIDNCLAILHDMAQEEAIEIPNSLKICQEIKQEEAIK